MKVRILAIITMLVGTNASAENIYQASLYPQKGFSYAMECIGDGQKVSFDLDLEKMTSVDHSRVKNLIYANPNDLESEMKIIDQKNKESQTGSYLVNFETTGGGYTIQNRMRITFWNQNFKVTQLRTKNESIELKCIWNLKN